LSNDALGINDPFPWTTRKVQKAIRVVRAGTFESSAVSNSNGLPDEQPFIASAVQIHRIVRGIATRKRVAKVLEKQRKNREKRKIRQQNKEKKGKKNKGSKQNAKSVLMYIELMSLETPTKICEVQTTSAPQNCLPSAWVWGTRITHTTPIKWCDGFICCVLNTCFAVRISWPEMLR
jgi:hypothetical protein